ncbi:hypothetical protein [Streptomyces sp. NPDC088554]|uniref:hypothetical protein n=1 Tax=Streptomyces sp. NPDC088554 TaxID=3365865 RepID=UPI00382ABA98
MSTAAFTSAPGPSVTGSDSYPGHPVGNALRAVKVFLSTAFSVAVLGEYSEEAGIKRR